MIRPLTFADVPKIPALLATDRPATAEDRERVQTIIEHLFPRLFLRAPNPDPDIHGLVSEEADGELSGMIGAIARRMEFQGRPIRAAVSAELFVNPAQRSQMLGMKLLKQIMNGPQDALISDIGNDAARRIWERLGGLVATRYGLNWVKPLRPGLWPLSWLGSSAAGRPLAWLGRPAALLADQILRRLAGQLCEVPPRPRVAEEVLTPDLFLELFPQFFQRDELRPVYDADTVAWIWSRLEFMHRDGGPSRQLLLRNARGELLGWYVFQMSHTGIVRVSQLVAHAHSVGQVLDHLLAQAQECGAVAVIGRMPPQFQQAIHDRHCLLVPRSTHTLVHSRRPELLEAFRQGRAVLSLFDAEGPLQIWNNPQLALDRLRQASLGGAVPKDVAYQNAI